MLSDFTSQDSQHLSQDITFKSENKNVFDDKTEMKYNDLIAHRNLNIQKRLSNNNIMFSNVKQVHTTVTSSDCTNGHRVPNRDSAHGHASHLYASISPQQIEAIDYSEYGF